MVLTLELPPEVEACLTEQAQAQGLEIAAYAARVPEQATLPLPPPPHRQMSKEEFTAALDQLAQHSEKIPLLPDEAFTRENLYQDHD